MTIKIGEQISALETAAYWLRVAGTSYLPKTHGVRAREFDYVLTGIAAAQTSLDWLAHNRAEFEKWQIEKRAARQEQGA